MLRAENRDLDLQRRLEESENSRKEDLDRFCQTTKEQEEDIQKLDKQVTRITLIIQITLILHMLY